MKPEEIYLSDLHRIFIGEVPASFYLELIFRAAFIYLLLMISMRAMGKKMSSQISRNEMAAVASLAAAVGIPLMNPDRGLLPGLIIAVVIVAFQILISKRASRNEKFEAITQDNLQTLVADGVMDLEEMKRTRITRERLFAQLRSLQKTNLGAVKRLYVEANGLFSMIEEKDPRPGLPLLPEDDVEFIGKMNTETGKCVCYNCGFLESHSIKSTRTLCNNCGDLNWVDAVL
jgi:uncharacterized membrane protein YcaP (DUF421 family)